MRLLLASNNLKKLAELRVLLGEGPGALPVELVAQGSLGIPEAEEPYRTFIENALAKARHAAAACSGAAMADDSGLCVDALGGAPGVVSAHFAPLSPPPSPGLDREALRRLQDAANNALLLERLLDHATPPERRAHFVCTLVAVRHADDPQPLVSTGRWPGQILLAARGDRGFGYDPLMHIPALGLTVAEMTAELKNAHSHRALAAHGMRGQLKAVWGL
jgi:XTP/dITP diphosphohydrolase